MSISEKQKVLNQLRQQVANRKAWVDNKSQTLNSRAARGMGANASAQEVSGNLQTLLPNDLVPGNVGDINKVIWPFFFRTNLQSPLVPAQTFTTTFSVTQEASFIWMSFTKAIYNVTDAGLPTEKWQYIDDNDPANAGLLQGLTFTVSDAQSTRDFMNTPVDLSQVGLARFPFKFPRPVMFLPNANVQINFTNGTGLTLVPFITAFGYRLRVENAQDILSLVYSGS
jgi:hypothetical protein